MENLSVAVMTAVNELAGRHGIKPYEFVAVLDTKLDHPTDIELRFESTPDQNVPAFDRMLEDLGVPHAGDDMPRLRGSEETIYRSLERALEKAPKRSKMR